MNNELKKEWLIHFKYSKVRMVSTWAGVMRVCREYDEVPWSVTSKPVGTNCRLSS
jgi:hypothetical protein